MAVDISDVTGLPDSKKREYYKFIKNRAPFSIEPIFVEPTYVYLQINAGIRYDINVTKIPSKTMETIIRNTITNYRDENLNDFNVTFRNSKLAKYIDNAEISIISSVLDIWLYKKSSLQPGVKQNLVLEYNTKLVDNIPKKNSIYPASDIHAFVSSTFRYNCKNCIFEDDGEGTVRLVATDGKTNQKIYDVGSIDYETGNVILNNITVDTFLGSNVKFYVKPRDFDISTAKNTILTIEEDEIIIAIEQLRD